MKEIGTNGFGWTVKNMIDEEERPVRKTTLLAFLDEWAKPVKTAPNSASYIQRFHSYKFDDYKKPKDADTAEYLYIDDKSGICLYKKQAKETKKIVTQQEKAFRECEAQLKELTKRAYELRQAFVKDFSTAKKHSNVIMALVLDRMMHYNCAREENVLQLLNIEKPSFDESTNYEERNIVLKALIQKQFEAAPERTLFVAAYCNLDDRPLNGYFSAYDWQLKIEHRQNESLNMINDILISLGYEMSDEERMLRDGTHELFIREKPA